ncbi:MAG: hypothetical protein AAB515_01835 [Patescibacteria group bacterium]
MTHEEFLNIFRKELLVGGPRREKLVMELGQHLGELGKHTDAITEFGRPDVLAKKYSQTHLGIFSSRLKIVALFALAWLFMENAHWLYASTLSTKLSVGQAGLVIAITTIAGNLLISIFFAFLLQKIHQKIIVIFSALFMFHILEVTLNILLLRDWDGPLPPILFANFTSVINISSLLFYIFAALGVYKILTYVKKQLSKEAD